MWECRMSGGLYFSKMTITIFPGPHTFPELSILHQFMFPSLERGQSMKALMSRMQPKPF